ncbi:hypothetical protein [Denitromonas ohlonensis]|uniref:Uncharacterized protein n=2 Tax=Denitromonas TaxID=139331 RepID=A0A557RLD5_9RHOO|nr:hypothetical protein [Denitromonas ohlonensis]TVO65925.1 hypothetical protein FHP90_10660 [Denitromonas ohlonensis]TVO79518.1 hypothetical protein FHP89_01845 [Denitromonas ohlonensis]
MGFVFLLLVVFLFVGVPLLIIYGCYRSDSKRHDRLVNEAGQSTEDREREGGTPQPEGPLFRRSSVLFGVSVLTLALAVEGWLHPIPPSTHRTLLGFAHMLLVPIFGNHADAAFMLLGSAFFFVIAQRGRAAGK